MNIRLKRILRGALKSWTMHFSTIGIALGSLEMYNKTISGWIGPENAGILLMFAGIVSVILRFKTTESLEMKGIK